MSRATIRNFIAEQPAALDRCVEAARAFAASWTPAPFDGIALVGAGSSLNGLHAARPRFVAAGRGAVTIHEPQDFVADGQESVVSAVRRFLERSQSRFQIEAGVQPLVCIVGEADPSDLRVVPGTALPLSALDGEPCVRGVLGGNGVGAPKRMPS